MDNIEKKVEKDHIKQLEDSKQIISILIKNEIKQTKMMELLTEQKMAIEDLKKQFE